jgi:HEAT repeat protein
LPAVSEFFESQPEPPRMLFLPRDRLFKMQNELTLEIGTIRDPETLLFLERFAVNGKAVGLRMNALQALRAISSPHSAPTFLKALDDANPDNGFSAMQGLLSLAGPGRSDWVPTWKQFDEAPTSYTAICREWWRTEGEQRMLSKNSARPF